MTIQAANAYPRFLFTAIAGFCSMALTPSRAHAGGEDCNLNGVEDSSEINPFGGYALDFDGNDDYVDCGTGSDLSLTTGFTLEAWVRPDSLSGIRRIVAKGAPGGYGFGQNAGRLRFTTFGIKDYDTAGVYLTVGVWTHVAVVLDASNDAHFYVNGLPVETIAGTNPANTTAMPFNIGRLANNIEYWDGLIDELRVWNTVRTDEQILESFNQSLNGDEAGMVAYWRLDEGGDATATDTANTNDGTLVNGPLWVPTPTDCNTNAVLDECEPTDDCNLNGMLDECDLLVGPNCNTNSIPDECETGGILGTYYDNIDFTGLAQTRLDPVVYFNWGNGPPLHR